ncbi:hypothetical protein GBAR_LOCUS5223 [Geodia barretti]|uniref:Sushi domain-containing protein n=1 Tax=Geodia barretti TaxID=519541 RepID=A0AA35RA61_GEOBA|nr:hypothetical protein GBAR_LOCUS5223 [Geodia barretti]
MSVTCTSTGSWTGTTPQCECDTGYRAVTVSGRQICQTESMHFTSIGWLSSCSNTFCFSGLRCPELQNPADGSVTYDSLHVGSRAVYTCSQGFRLVGCDSVRTCGSDGAWSGQPPLCNSEVCTVELVGDIEVVGTSATFVFRGVGSALLDTPANSMEQSYQTVPVL